MMESTILWALIVAIAVIVLLVVFWVASERELKKSRQMVEQLAASMGDSPESNSQAVNVLNASEAPSTEDLQGKIRDLEIALAEANKQVETTRHASIELQSVQDSQTASQSRAEQLQQENQQLQTQIAELKQALNDQSNRQEPNPTAMASSDQETQLKNEIASLTEQLEIANARAQEFATVEAQLAQANSREIDLRAGQERLQTQLDTSLKELESERQKITDLEKQVGDYQQAQTAVNQWQDWTNARQQQMNEVQQRWQNWLRSQETLQKDQQELSDAFNSLQQAMESPQVATLPDASTAQKVSTSSAEITTTVDSDIGATDTNSRTDQAAPASTSETIDGPPSGNKRTVGIVAALFFVCIIGVLLANSFQKQSGDALEAKNTTRVPANVVYKVSLAGPSDALPGAETNAMMSDEGAVAPMQETSKREAQDGALAKRAQGEPTVTAKANNAARAPEKISQQRLWGLYQTTQPSRVFQAPNENSELIADLPTGIKINVVSIRNGWLEVRSRHGRPPGFIRSEAAVRIDGGKR